MVSFLELGPRKGMYEAPPSDGSAYGKTPREILNTYIPAENEETVELSTDHFQARFNKTLGLAYIELKTPDNHDKETQPDENIMQELADLETQILNRSQGVSIVINPHKISFLGALFKIKGSIGVFGEALEHPNLISMHVAASETLLSDSQISDPPTITETAMTGVALSAGIETFQKLTQSTLPIQSHRTLAAAFSKASDRVDFARRSK
jgi:hypothetical protein